MKTNGPCTRPTRNACRAAATAARPMRTPGQRQWHGRARAVGAQSARQSPSDRGDSASPSAGTDLPVHDSKCGAGGGGTTPPYEGSSPVPRLAQLNPAPNRLRACLVHANAYGRAARGLRPRRSDPRPVGRAPPFPRRARGAVVPKLSAHRRRGSRRQSRARADSRSVPGQDQAGAGRIRPRAEPRAQRRLAASQQATSSPFPTTTAGIRRISSSAWRTSSS